MRKRHPAVASTARLTACRPRRGAWLARSPEILTDRQQSIFGLIEKKDLVDAILRKCTVQS